MSDDNDSLIESEKQMLTDALYQCMQYLKNTNKINDQVSDAPSDESGYLAYEITKSILELIRDATKKKEEELFLFKENIGELDPAINVEDDATNKGEICYDDYDSYDFEADDHSDSDDDTNADVIQIYESPSEYSESQSQPVQESSLSSWECTPEFKGDYIPLDYKIKVVNMKREYKNWKLPSIQANGGGRLVRMDELSRWRKDIRNGGIAKDKLIVIDKWTYDRFKESRDSGRPVFTRDLRVWALQAARQFLGAGFKFKASRSWVTRFKQRHRIRMRKVTRYVKPTEQNSRGEKEISNAEFRADTSGAIVKYQKKFVVNTDQTGCQYRVDISRTLAPRGSKAIEAYLGDLNKVSHSYTAQYTITAEGTILPKVYICLQETSDAFGPRVQKGIDELVAKYKNVYVTCSKSGKMSKALVCSYIEHILKPYVTDKFLLIQDSWGGQGNNVVLEKLNEIGHEYEVFTVPPGCTGDSQPLDVYFFRQVKIFISRLQNATELAAEDRQLHSRKDAIKIQSLVHNQFSAPVFKDMIQYAWYSSGLIKERTVFFNVNQVCFPENCPRKICKIGSCNGMGFIKCSWCEEYLCFACFYDAYHPQACAGPKS